MPLGSLSPYALTLGAVTRFAGGTLISVFRRRAQSAPTPAPETSEVIKPGGKGRPTPKRSEAQQRRRQPITAPPKDRREAVRKLRERQAQDRARAREGMRRGEERYLPKRDKGPVRKLARDYVDSRRTIGSYLMWAMFAVVAISLVPNVYAKLLMLVGPPLMLGVVLVEGLLISGRVKRLAAERFPAENQRGVGLYAATRAMQIRRFRIPPPELGPGDKAKV